MHPPLITPAQIESLFKFCRKHYVHYYDLQTELVDHLATGIEEKMRQQPGITFEQALDAVYKGFGYSGFAKIVAERTAQMQKPNGKIRRRFFWAYFTWPKLAFTLFLFTALYTVLQQLPEAYLLPASAVLFFLLQLLNYRLVRRLQQYRKQQQAQLLLVDGVSGPFFLVAFWQLYFYVVLFSKKHNWEVATGWWNPTLLLSVLFVLAVLSVLSYDAFMRSLYREARNTYPAAFKEA